MKKSVLIFIFFSVFLLVGRCKKNTDTIPYGTSLNYSETTNPNTNTGGAFSFTKIIISPNPVRIGTASKLTAVATGNNLTYKWSTSHGDLFGTGYSIYYSDSCIGTYTVTCTVSDGTHTATITVPITITN